jgi:hypothetical protein
MIISWFLGVRQPGASDGARSPRAALCSVDRRILAAEPMLRSARKFRAESPRFLTRQARRTEEHG